ncbi:MAG: hypothetical protein K8T20_05110 [Planctomycetes bacterium]|nr:hypothetical protein [Planctomycetota bacterium]
MTNTRSLLAAVACALLFVAPFASAEDKKAEGPRAVPEGTPLELKITGKTTTYTLTKADAEAFAKTEEIVKKGGTELPEAPKIDLTLEIRNTSEKAIKVWTSGDPVVLTVTVKGKGALNLLPQLAYTEEFRMPVSAEIAPGKSLSMPLKSLRSGFRGTSHYACWTAAGDYELVVEMKTGVSPRPEGATEAQDGFGNVVLTSAPFAVKVEMAK